MSDQELEALRRQLAERGLRFSDDDLRELLRGWRGLQPQIERVRARLAEPEGE